MLTKDKDERKTFPLYRGLFQYFPAALAEVAKVSHVGNEQHNPGQECFDNREKSNDDYDCMLRHMVEAEDIDDDGMLHAAKVAWRALRACQKILERRGHAAAPAARWPESMKNGYTFVPASAHVMVPQIHSIGPEQEECGNDIQNRIAGQTEASRAIKNEYYGVGTNKHRPIPPQPGERVRDVRDGWEGRFMRADGAIATVSWTLINGREADDVVGMCALRNLVPV